MPETGSDLSAAWRQASVTDVLPVPAIPSTPLARTVAMPARMGFATGAISIRLFDLRLSGLSDRAAGAALTGDDHAARLLIRLPGLRLAGRAGVDAKNDPAPTVDYGGGMRRLAPESVSAGERSGAADPSTKEEWLIQARAQRPVLANSPSGKYMLTTYYANNYTYAELFQNNSSVQNAWNQDDATTAMAADTHQAVGDGVSVVNSSTKVYANSQTYNGTAFTQQTQIAAACYMISYDNQTSDPALAQRYLQASTDALSFGTNVTTGTGNSSSVTIEMTAPQVQTAVSSSDPAQQVRLTAAQTHAIGRALIGLPPTGAAAEQEALAMVAIPDHDRDRAQRLVEEMRRERAERSTIPGTPLYEGALHARIGMTEAVVDVTRSAADAAWVVEHVEVALPHVDLQIDDSGWDGVAADEIRRTLPEVRFLRDMIEAAIVDALGPALAAVARGALHVSAA